MSGLSSLRHQHIFTARADGSRARDLTPKLPRGLLASDPDFSPDGRTIAYAAEDRLISVPANGSWPRLLIPPRVGSDGTYANPAPDGRSLLFVAQNGGSTLGRLDLKTRRRLPKPLVEPHTGVTSPAWLPVPRG